MATAEQFNEFFYDVLLNMEDWARNALDAEEQDLKEKEAFYDKLKEAIKQMNKTEIFEDNLLSFCSTLTPDEEDILFYHVAVPMFEILTDSISDEEEMGKNGVRIFSMLIASKTIVKILDGYLGYSYFLKIMN